MSQTQELTSLDQVSNEDLLAVLRSLALEKCSSNLSLFADTFFSQHLTLAMPDYHKQIYSELASIILGEGPGTPPKAFEMRIRPSPKSLQFSKVQASNCNKLSVNDSNLDSGRLRETSQVPMTQKDAIIANSSNLSASDDASGSPVLSRDLEGRATDIFRNSVVIEPREFGKSTKAMIYVMWCILNQYKKFILYISKSFDHAVKLVGPIKREFEANEELRDVYGDVRSGKWTESEMEFSTGSKILAVGRGQTVRGLKYLNWRPDLVILDDIEDDESVNNGELRMKLHEWLDKQVLKGVDSRRGNVSAFGTILHPDSLLANISASKNRAEKYKDFKVLFYGALNERERSIWEEKFSTAQLLEEKRKDPYTFAQERMNQPIPLGSGMFKKEYFHYFTLEDGVIVQDGRRIRLSDCNLYLTCDIAITEKEYSDYTVLLVSAISPQNQIFFLEYTRARWEDPDKIIAELFRLNRKYPDMKVTGVEETAAQRWLIVNLRKEMEKRDHFFSLRALKADRDKLRRISQLQPRFENRSVFLRNTMMELEEELLLFPKAAHDDIADAAAYLLQIALPGEPEADSNTRPIRPAYRFSVDGEDVLKGLMEKGKQKGVFKEYKTGEDFDPYAEDSFENAMIQRWNEEEVA